MRLIHNKTILNNIDCSPSSRTKSKVFLSINPSVLSLALSLHYIWMDRHLNTSSPLEPPSSLSNRLHTFHRLLITTEKFTSNQNSLSIFLVLSVPFLDTTSFKLNKIIYLSPQFCCAGLWLAGVCESSLVACAHEQIAMIVGAG